MLYAYAAGVVLCVIAATLVLGVLVAMVPGPRRRAPSPPPPVTPGYAEMRLAMHRLYNEGELDAFVRHGRRREPTPDLLKDLHRRQEAARGV